MSDTYQVINRQISGVDGQVLANTQVAVLVGTINGSVLVDAATQPGSPLALLYADPQGEKPISNPTKTDGFGNLCSVYEGVETIGVYVNSGANGDGTNYVLQVYGGRVTPQQLIPYTVPNALTVGPRPLGLRWNYCNFNNANPEGGNGVSQVGFAMASYRNGGSSVIQLTTPTTTRGQALQLTGAGSGVGIGNGFTFYDNFCGVLSGAPNSINLAILRHWEYAFGIDIATATTAGCWYYLGLGVLQPNGGSFIAHSTIVTGDIVGFRFDPINYADTHWMAICQIGSGAITAANTGVVPEAGGAPHIFTIESDGVHVFFSIDGSNVASIAVTHTSGATTGYYSFATGSDESSTTADHATGYSYYLYDETL